jgi:VanZ family protein
MSIKLVLKLSCVAALVLLVFIGLGPANWQPRSGLGWEIDHFVGYFVLTSMFCLAWPRPLLVAAVLIAFAAALEALQALTPDRSSNPMAALYGACGVLAAALMAYLSIRGHSARRSRSLSI